MSLALEQFVRQVGRMPDNRRFGRVTGVQGLLVEVAGIEKLLSVGGRCTVLARGGRRVPCEAVGFRQGRALLMPLGTLEGVGLGCEAELSEDLASVFPSQHWLGRWSTRWAIRWTAAARCWKTRSTPSTPSAR